MLKPWLANMNIKHVFNEYKTVTYMRSYFSKSEDQCSEAMSDTANEAFKNSQHHYKTMITISRAYLRKHECSVQKAV